MKDQACLQTLYSSRRAKSSTSSRAGLAHRRAQRPPRDAPVTSSAGIKRRQDEVLGALRVTGRCRRRTPRLRGINPRSQSVSVFELPASLRWAADRLSSLQPFREACRSLTHKRVGAGVRPGVVGYNAGNRPRRAKASNAATRPSGLCPQAVETGPLRRLGHPLKRSERADRSRSACTDRARVAFVEDGLASSTIAGQVYGIVFGSAVVE